ncbi:MAG: hypothetical protein ACKO2K_02825 [Alphaproteobacteria bacterium]
MSDVTGPGFHPLDDVLVLIPDSARRARVGRVRPGFDDEIQVASRPAARGDSVKHLADAAGLRANPDVSGAPSAAAAGA